MSDLVIIPEKIVFTGTMFSIYDISDLLPKNTNYPYGSSEIDKTTGKRSVSG